MNATVETFELSFVSQIRQFALFQTPTGWKIVIPLLDMYSGNLQTEYFAKSSSTACKSRL